MRVIRSAFLFVALLSFGCSSQATLQRVRVEYSPSEDLACSLPPGSPIKEEWKAELLSRQPEFVRLWQSEGPKLLTATETISGRNFPLDEITARLTLCNAPSESFPGIDRVTNNMRY